MLIINVKLKIWKIENCVYSEERDFILHKSWVRKMKFSSMHVNNSKWLITCGDKLAFWTLEKVDLIEIYLHVHTFISSSSNVSTNDIFIFLYVSRRRSSVERVLCRNDDVVAQESRQVSRIGYHWKFLQEAKLDVRGKGNFCNNSHFVETLRKTLRVMEISQKLSQWTTPEYFTCWRI